MVKKRSLSKYTKLVDINVYKVPDIIKVGTFLISNRQ